MNSQRHHGSQSQFMSFSTQRCRGLEHTYFSALFSMRLNITEFFAVLPCLQIYTICQKNWIPKRKYHATLPGGIPGKNFRQIFSAGKKHDGLVSFFCIKRPGRVKKAKEKKNKKVMTADRVSIPQLERFSSPTFPIFVNSNFSRD